MYSVLPGRGRVEAIELSDAALVAWGEMAARVGRALRGFFHPAAQRTMLWDVQHAGQTRELLGSIRDPGHRELVRVVLDRFEASVVPAWPSLRAQVVHTDLTTDNALTDDDGVITGIVDFGDMSHSALVTDLASVLDSLLIGRTGDELFRSARLVLDGYQRVTPLEPMELRLMGELLAARAAVTIAISSWRSERGLEDPTFAERYNAPVARGDRDVAVGRVGRGSSAVRRGGRWPPHGRTGGTSRGGPRPGHGIADLRRADPRGERQRRLDDGDRRPALPRRLQQRAVRRARASPGRGGRRAAGAPAQHEHALPPRVGDRPGRAADRVDAARLRARHRAVRQLRLRGERCRVAAGDDVHRQPRSVVHGVRLPRRDRRDRRPVAGVVAGIETARARRGLGATGPPARHRPRRGPVRRSARAARNPRAGARGRHPRQRPDE